MEEPSDKCSHGKNPQASPMETTRAVEAGDWGSLHQGDCLAILQTMPENSVDAIVTDPPAGIAFLDSAWDNPWEYGTSGHGYTDGARRVNTPVVSSSRNPMCRKCRRHRRGWKDVPGCECPAPDFDEADRRLTAARIFVDRMAAIFHECLRVLKPGGFAAIWSLPRTSHWTGTAIELSGFEIQNCIYHIFGQGLPKGLNLAIQFEKRLCRQVERKWRYVNTGEEMRRIPPFRDAEANRWAGWNTALKPAAECWWLARKPVTESNIAGNVLRWGVGGLNIGACRVGRGSDQCNDQSNEQFRAVQPRGAHREADAHNGIGMVSDAWGATDPESGRWPSNLVFSHSPECRKAGIRRIRNRSGSVAASAPSAPARHTYGEYKRRAFKRHGDADGYETIEEWTCVEWCPVRQLDAQSGYSETRRNGNPSDCAGNTWGGTFQTNRGPRGYTDAGGASRYFTVLEPDVPFYYVRKASRKERHAGCDMSEAREVGHNRFDRCARCGGTIFQNPSRPSACKCEQPMRRDNAVQVKLREDLTQEEREYVLSELARLGVAP
ncbi:MAG: site-specific DNA-methyltransferase [Chloroflexi bacterium]|nr:site-specific DNA-methyltransferase [Chloroflexota bacterium]